MRGSPGLHGNSGGWRLLPSPGPGSPAHLPHGIGAMAREGWRSGGAFHRRTHTAGAPGGAAGAARRQAMDISLEGKRALVTGANSGNGASSARALASAGARVADARQVAAMFEALDRRWDGIDVLVNNAGVDGVRAVAWEADPAEWFRVIRVDLLGPFQCAREALRRMVARKSGVILNLTSVHEKIAWGGYSAYTAAKAGLSMLTKTLAQEAAPFGVRVVALAPGAIRTPINRAVWSDPAGLADLVAKIPLGRMGEPEEVARVAAFLVSDAASYLTGSTVYVDGAMTDDPEFARGG